jgi:hypothetical protein
VIRAEKGSGASRVGRTELQTLLDFLRPGDTLVVTRIDRLARSIKDLQDIVYMLKERGVSLKATEQPIDTLSAAGKAFFKRAAYGCKLVRAHFRAMLPGPRVPPPAFGTPSVLLTTNSDPGRFVRPIRSHRTGPDHHGSPPIR